MRREMTLGLTADASIIASQKRWEDPLFLTTVVFWSPETRTTHGLQSFGIGKVDCGTVIVLAPEADVGRCQLSDVGRDLPCLCLHPTLRASCSTTLEHNTVLKNAYAFGFLNTEVLLFPTEKRSR